MYHQDLLDIPVHTMQDNINRFTKYGEILKTVSNGIDEAMIGKVNERIYIVFYPDGTYDRFENGQESIELRDGWNGVVRERVVSTTVTPKSPVDDEKPKKARAKKPPESWLATLEMVIESSVTKKSSPKTSTKTTKSTSAKKKTIH